MSEWVETTLGALIHVKHGFAFKGEFFETDGDEIVLTPGNFKIGGGLQFRPGKEKYYSGEYPSHFRLEAGRLVVVMTDLKQSAPILGSAARVPATPPTLHNQRLGLVEVRAPHLIDEDFLYHLLNDDSSRRQLRATATGATVRHTAPNRIGDISFGLPPIAEQRAIASILGSIDDLIENNRRRIEVLEEMAQAIYREWFVHFRFPGHEDATFVDAPLGPIPDGWEATTIGDVLTLKYGKALKKANRIPGIVAVVGSSGVVDTHVESLVSGPSIVIGRKGNVGSVTWLRSDCWPIDTTYFVDTDLPLHFVRRQLMHSEFKNTHAAVPGLSREMAYSLPFVLPRSELLDDFQSIAEKLDAQKASLTSANDRLAAIRDLLLPKLVTGEIDVSDLDLDELIEAAG